MEEKPVVVCLCGSTRFSDEFARATCRETLLGKIVLSIGCNLRDAVLSSAIHPERLDEVKERLDVLHKRKIDLADEILVLDKEGYIGPSTHSEIAYAYAQHKQVRFLSHEYPETLVGQASPMIAHGSGTTKGV